MPRAALRAALIITVINGEEAINCFLAPLRGDLVGDLIAGKETAGSSPTAALAVDLAAGTGSFLRGEGAFGGVQRRPVVGAFLRLGQILQIETADELLKPSVGAPALGG